MSFPVNQFFKGILAQDAVLTLYPGAENEESKTIKVIFDNKYQAAKILEMNIEGSMPMATCKDSDIVGVSHDDTLEINNVTYLVKELQPDGSGITALLLSLD